MHCTHRVTKETHYKVVQPAAVLIFRVYRDNILLLIVHPFLFNVAHCNVRLSTGRKGQRLFLLVDVNIQKSKSCHSA